MATPPLMATGLPKRRALNTIFLPVSFSDTTSVVRGWLPKGCYITGMYVIGAAASAAVTSAVIGVGTTSAANELVTGYDVKTTATGKGFNAVGTAAVPANWTKSTTDLPLYVKYTGVGGGDSGSWNIKVDYVMVGPGETL